MATAALGGVLQGDRNRVGLDVVFTPSPVPEQTGRSNYVDNDRVGTALGWSYGFSMASARFRVGLNGQLQWLLPRSVTKSERAVNPVVDEFPTSVDLQGNPLPSSNGLQTNNPGYPGFSSRGVLLAASATLGVTL
jgi:hypothetical protein